MYDLSLDSDGFPEQIEEQRVLSSTSILNRGSNVRRKSKQRMDVFISTGGLLSHDNEFVEDQEVPLMHRYHLKNYEPNPLPEHRFHY